MTNEWQLTFFYIRENSKIYLEFLQIVDKVCLFIKNIYSTLPICKLIFFNIS